tara:strand:- start:29 stop:871 length:843 start_codon:yes stop_codon:yes gene_type:complete
LIPTRFLNNEKSGNPLVRDRHGILPGFISVLVHVVLFGSFLLAFDFSQPVQTAVLLPIEATLVTEEELEPPPVDELPEPPARSIEVEESRVALEEEKRLADLRAEQERIRLQQDEDRKRREKAEADRKRRQEAETERRRAEAERRRLEEMEQQRVKNERLRREAEQAEIRRRQEQEVLEEQNRILAMQADDKVRWVFALQQAISRNFVPPASVPIDLECVVDVRQLPGGTVANVSVGRCNGDAAVKRAIEAAVYKASPLPPPDNPRIFDRDLRITFKPEY